MPQAIFLKHVPHRPDDLMDLVANVEDYPRFISLISALRITRKTKVSERHEQFEAEAVIAYKFISETFRSIVDVRRAARRIEVKKANKAGAIKSLINNWIFYELSDGSTLIKFDIEVTMKAYPLEVLMRDKFAKTASKVMDIFVKRAGETYETIGDSNLDIDAEMSRLNLA